jgi:hypothetical protein
MLLGWSRQQQQGLQAELLLLRVAGWVWTHEIRQALPAWLYCMLATGCGACQICMLLGFGLGFRVLRLGKEDPPWVVVVRTAAGL